MKIDGASHRRTGGRQPSFKAQPARSEETLRNGQEWAAQNCAPPPNDDLDIPDAPRRDLPPKEVAA